MGVVVLLLSGTAVYYRKNLQSTIALSATEYEFNTMANAGVDNQGAPRISNAQQPT